MFKVGDAIVLTVEKHTEESSLPIGSVGIIATIRSGSLQFVVNFGNEGALNCFSDEMSLVGQPTNENNHYNVWDNSENLDVPGDCRIETDNCFRNYTTIDFEPITGGSVAVPGVTLFIDEKNKDVKQRSFEEDLEMEIFKQASK